MCCVVDYYAMTILTKLPSETESKQIIVLKKSTINIFRVCNCHTMTIVTKLPSEAEKKKEAEANEVPLVQVAFIIIIILVIIIHKIILIVIILIIILIDTISITALLLSSRWIS